MPKITFYSSAFQQPSSFILYDYEGSVFLENRRKMFVSEGKVHLVSFFVQNNLYPTYLQTVARVLYVLTRVAASAWYRVSN